MKLSMIAATLLSVSTLSIAHEAGLSREFSVTVPYGQSIVDYHLAEGEVINPVRVLYKRTPSCPSIPATGVEVQYEGADEWLATDYGLGGYYFHTDARVSKIRLNLSQYSYRSEYCTILIKNPNPDHTPPEQDPKQEIAGYVAAPLER
ncbi:hypothetical protein [Pseudobacteriovorax antillogorgiicola]|uniref:Uncharacterized protein n=1 Tax=Pseudobacteriovorax antillogorgiicola TaxID=1513793 RepID=A0A1Y6CBT9_9BACT|nr:hypothetical protein [Pseudobacteriovorax antillogorgiicola]TCS48661.1 hypothetical protein EDD56_11783 [Pseudobacteriovorax antillogorgiicola]SMF55086.1 hypothetical protein SAMN06296036_11776 [Pseudobacteriovorax antillogorgiicola]